ncbi:MAG: hypothetical protein ACXWTP_06490 [Methylosarcina sp.]
MPTRTSFENQLPFFSCLAAILNQSFTGPLRTQRTPPNHSQRDEKKITLLLI